MKVSMLGLCRSCLLGEGTLLPRAADLLWDDVPDLPTPPSFEEDPHKLLNECAASRHAAYPNTDAIAAA